MTKVTVPLRDFPPKPGFPLPFTQLKGTRSPVRFKAAHNHLKSKFMPYDSNEDICLILYNNTVYSGVERKIPFRVFYPQLFYFIIYFSFFREREPNSQGFRPWKFIFLH
ncbi:hypothetical protein D3OALGA1CA_5694 [Olavius algarvensis associated proteobacterium Delta 3]|nr:hypothetical protein D3OALGB2SA_2480 [Olavius algarvensis associated proteobacterium Delta 3]CAB5170415.1 hypothetical protein D3OALGA1CA_5694 [Olavius algarvensis associated proteobacterium Delta 3]